MTIELVIAELQQGRYSVEQAATWMSENGSSVWLGWGEDTGAWECSWITGGVRYTGVEPSLREAILESLRGSRKQR